MIYEVVDNAVDEALAGYCKNIEVTLNEDSSVTVKTMVGIPVDIHKTENKSRRSHRQHCMQAVSLMTTHIRCRGLHGVGVSVVNACQKNCH